MVVDHVMTLDPLSPARTHAEMVDGVMGAVISEIPQGKPREERIGEHTTKKHPEQQIKREAERDARAEWEDQTVRILGKIVVNAVQHEMKTSLPQTRAYVVKHEAVKDVFRERPREKPREAER